MTFHISHTADRSYSFNGHGPNPTLWLTAGIEYTFIVSDPEEFPFYIAAEYRSYDGKSTLAISVP